MESVFWRTYFSPSALPSVANSAVKDADEAWALLRRMVIAVIDEVKNSDASTDVNDSIEDVNDFLVTASAASRAVISLQKNLSRKISRFFVSKISPATGVTYPVA